MDVLRVENLVVDCVVGVYPHEREVSQPLRVDLQLRLPTEAAAVEESLRATVDYTAVVEHVTFLLRNCRFRLLETAAHVLAKYLLAGSGAGRARVETVVVRLTKPGALQGFAVPSLEIERSAGWGGFEVEQRTFGSVEVIQETKDVGIFRLVLAPGETVSQQLPEQTRRADLVLGSGLTCQGEPCPAGTIHDWPGKATYAYDNPTSRHQTILCVDSPRRVPW